MPIVRPDIENRVSLRPVTDAKVRAADFGQDTYGRAIAQAGGQLSEIADRQERINAVYDEAAAKRVDNEAMLKLGELRRKAMAAKGFDAQAARLDFETQARAIKDELTGNLKNDRQKFLFSSAYDSRLTSDLDRVYNHADSEVRTASVNESAARAVNFKDRAVDMRDDPEEFARSLATGESEILSAASLQGMGEADKAQAVAQYRSSVYVSAAEAIDDVLLKEDYVNRNAANILPDDETKMRRAMKPALEEARVDALEGEALARVGLIVAEADADTPASDDATPGERQKETAAAKADPLRGKGRRTSSMGVRKDPITGETRDHAGADYAAPAGTPVYPVSTGKVVWAKPKGGYGNYVVVRHADGRETAYGHLRNINVRVGDEVGVDDVIGGVGSTGRSTGNHLHLEVRDAKGRLLDPERQTWAQGQLPRYKADRVDKEAYYEAARQLAEEKNLTLPQYNALLRRMDAHVNRQDDLVQREEQEQRRAAEETVAKIEAQGGELTSVEQIPNFGALPPAVQSAYRREIKQNTMQEAAPEASGDLYFTLEDMASRADSQAGFLQVDLEQYRGAMTKGEFNRLKKKQLDIRNGGGAEGTVAANYARIGTAINRYAPQVDIVTGQGKKASDKANLERRAKLSRLVEAEVAQEQTEKNRQLTDPELDAVVRKYTRTVTVKEPGFWGQRDVAKPYFEIAGQAGTVAVPDIPAAAQKQIRSAFKRTYGRLPTLNEELDIYTRSYRD
jgi:murein DD-endopeptidase MepM/ murein hydrolase activator NlpD